MQLKLIQNICKDFNGKIHLAFDFIYLGCLMHNLESIENKYYEIY